MVDGRLQQNGHLSQASVTDVQIGETFESTAAFFTRLKVTYSTESKHYPHTDLIFKNYREGWFGGGIAESVFFNEIVAKCPIHRSSDATTSIMTVMPVNAILSLKMPL